MISKTHGLPLEPIAFDLLALSSSLLPSGLNSFRSHSLTITKCALFFCPDLKIFYNIVFFFLTPTQVTVSLWTRYSKQTVGIYTACSFDSRFFVRSWIGLFFLIEFILILIFSTFFFCALSLSVDISISTLFAEYWTDTPTFAIPLFTFSLSD